MRLLGGVMRSHPETRVDSDGLQVNLRSPRGLCTSITQTASPATPRPAFTPGPPLIEMLQKRLVMIFPRHAPFLFPVSFGGGSTSS